MSVTVFHGVKSSYLMGKTFGVDDLAGIERLSFMEKENLKGKAFHVAAHFVSSTFVPKKDWFYDPAHAHDFDEINMLISNGDCLKYKMEFDGVTQEISSPALIFIPAGTRHRGEVVEGTGIFICLYMNQEGKK